MLDIYCETLIDKLEARIRTGEITWRDARELFLMDDLRETYLKVLTEGMMFAVPANFTILREKINE